MTTDDPQDFAGRLESERERLANSTDVFDADRDAIRAWLRQKDGTVSVSSMEVYLRRTRLASERADGPLVEMDTADFHDLVFHLRHDHGLSDASIQGYENAVLMLVEDMTGAEWPAEIDRTTVDDRTLDPDAILTPADIQALTSAARHQRDVAFIEFLADTGARLSMALSLRIRDVDLTKPPTYSPNANATGLKGAPQSDYPLIDSAAPIRSYLRTSHPRPDNPDVALFHKVQPPKRDGTGWSDDGSPAPNGIRQQVNRLAENAGVDKPTNPHAFRHAAVTRMVREGYSRSQIEHRVHWTLDTNMWETYEHITGTEHTEDIFREAGVIESDDAPERVRKPCGNCGEPLAPHHDWCGNCGEPASAAAEAKSDDTRDTFMEKLVDATNPTTRRELREALDALDENPDAAHDDPS